MVTNHTGGTMTRIMIVCLCAALLPGLIHAQNSQKIIQDVVSLVDNGAVILCDEDGTPVLSHNANTLFVPASIIKILTAYVALEKLGKDYRFKTEFYKDNNNNCIIKGFGDPYLVSEEITLIAKELKQKGIQDINRLLLDHSAFEPVITIPGVSKTSNPYDALNGALVTNFNTINVRKDRNGRLLSAEEQTPLTPLARSRAAIIGAGTKERINLSVNKQDCLQYAGELFAAIFNKESISIATTAISKTDRQATWNKYYTHYNSRELPDILKGLLKYSNNFIANQIFLTIGAEEKGYPATFANAKIVFENFVRTNLNIDQSDMVVVEGSGISRKNKTTGLIMINILEQFKEYASLLPSKKGALVKSGTLSGVYNYAGYIKTSQGLRPFVIMLNQKRNTRDTILQLLAKIQ
ncbi:MAG: penicillin-binding protein 4 [Chitinivibrionales bacterium]|nr:penicillin-binding protein 4 [Chitinivibrionales bacterium]